MCSVIHFSEIHFTPPDTDYVRAARPACVIVVVFNNNNMQSTCNRANYVYKAYGLCHVSPRVPSPPPGAVK